MKSENKAKEMVSSEISLTYNVVVNSRYRVKFDLESFCAFGLEGAANREASGLPLSFSLTRVLSTADEGEIRFPVC